MDSSTTRIRSGDLLDHYRIEALVVTGGMASLFRATDTRTGGTVAVKIPHPEKANARVLASLYRPTEVGKEFDHPGLVKELPSQGRGHRYVVMEWAEGRLLRQIMDEPAGLSLERSVQIALKICQVLAYIHERGVVHLDLKPENIIVDRNDDIKLIDFDLARRVKPGLLALFQPKRMGTPDYASPEQIKGKPCSVRSDIYSLGLILYEMLTGEVPFSGVAPRTAIKLRLLTDPPPPCEINPDIPEDLQELVCRSISRDPAKRPATARILGVNLVQIQTRWVHELLPSL